MRKSLPKARGRGRPPKPEGRHTDLSRRLLLLIEQHNLTVQDLAILFQRYPYQTVFSWTHRDREPHRFYRDAVYLRLAQIEALAARRAKKKRLLVPKELKLGERGEYVRNLVARSYLPEPTPAG